MTKDLDEVAIRDFRARHGDLRFAPVTVVIAAYQEAESIGAVLEELPTECCGLQIDKLVVVDGGTDETAAVALAHDAYVCVTPTNRGQGTALRLGYELAREGGARFIVTTDADGQYDGSQLPTLLQPLVDGEADFVTGSRWLGRQETTDWFRRLGSRVFAQLATVLTGQRITDTSFGFRAMKAEVTAAITLRQPQYQSSELLIAVVVHGYRVVERPMTLRERRRGHSKKGSNLFYGARYGRALIGTWLRERRRRRYRGRAAAAGSG